MRLIDADALLDDAMDRYCKKCEKRKGIKNGKYRIIYEVGDAPCRSCGIDAMTDEIDNASTIQPEPQWIPMSEREPEFGNYLTTYREKATGKVDIAIDLYWSGGWDDDGDKFETLAWMPLPESYKGGNE